jgi:hypothetical protein
METLFVRTYRVIPDLDDPHEMETHAPVLTGEEARQGVISGRIVSVLMASLALAVVAGAILVGYHWI